MTITEQPTIEQVLRKVLASMQELTGVTALCGLVLKKHDLYVEAFVAMSQIGISDGWGERCAEALEDIKRYLDAIDAKGTTDANQN